LEQRRDAALTKAITEGDPVVSKILDLLESDLVNVIDPLIKTGEKEHLAELVTYYNDNRKKMSQSERRQIIDNINAAAEQYSTALIFNPSSLVSGMIQAHQALIKYAKSSKKPNDFAELVSVLEVFTAHVDTVAGAIQEFQNK
jgi:ribosome maturation protein Sdo1